MPYQGQQLFRAPAHWQLAHNEVGTVHAQAADVRCVYVVILKQKVQSEIEVSINLLSILAGIYILIIPLALLPNV